MIFIILTWQRKQEHNNGSTLIRGPLLSISFLQGHLFLRGATLGPFIQPGSKVISETTLLLCGR